MEDVLPKDRKSRARSRTKDEILDDLINSRKQGSEEHKGPMVEDMLRGVTVSWLAQVFSMDPKTVKQKLADCPPMHKRKAGYVYNLATACRYLIPPAMSAEQYIKTVKPSELPSVFQQAFWDAALKRQKWEENAGQLWRTEKVQAVLGQVFQTTKFSVQLWSDTVEREMGITDEQRAKIIELSDELLAEIHRGLLAMKNAEPTKSQLGEIDEMAQVQDGLRPSTVEVDADEDYTQLI